MHVDQIIGGTKETIGDPQRAALCARQQRARILEGPAAGLDAPLDLGVCSGE
jgi:hypothetical protein